MIDKQNVRKRIANILVNNNIFLEAPFETMNESILFLDGSTNNLQLEINKKIKEIKTKIIEYIQLKETILYFNNDGINREIKGTIEKTIPNIMFEIDFNIKVK